MQSEPGSVKKHHVEKKSNGLVSNRTLEALPFISSLKFGLMIMVTLWIGVLRRSGADVFRVSFSDSQIHRIIYLVKNNFRQLSSSWRVLFN